MPCTIRASTLCYTLYHVYISLCSKTFYLRSCQFVITCSDHKTLLIVTKAGYLALMACYSKNIMDKRLVKYPFNLGSAYRGFFSLISILRRLHTLLFITLGEQIILFFLILLELKKNQRTLLKQTTPHNLKGITQKLICSLMSTFAGEIST